MNRKKELASLTKSFERHIKAKLKTGEDKIRKAYQDYDFEFVPKLISDVEVRRLFLELWTNLKKGVSKKILK